MSGGSMDYLCYKVADAVFHTNTPERKAFREHLSLIAKALRAIEWNDSGDGADNEEELIRACIGKNAVLETLIKELSETIDSIKKELEDLTKALG